MTNLTSMHTACSWSELQLVHKLYAALAQEFSIELSPCAELENGGVKVSPETLAAARAWLAEADLRIPVHQLRQFLQTSPLANEEGLRAVLTYSLGKQEHSDSDRDKTDFLLVQLFSVCAPSLLEDSDVSFEFVASTLEPVLGSGSLTPFESLQGLDEVITTAGACHKLHDLFASGVIEKGRRLKLGAAHNYFEPAALVSFTRFNFLLRRCFFRAMHRDLNAILDGLRDLELRGVESLDCRSAELSAEEPVGRLRMICQSWKAMFQAEYSYGQPLRMLVDLRNAVESALASNDASSGNEATANHETAGEPDESLRAKAAAAGEFGETGASSNESASSEDF